MKKTFSSKKSAFSLIELAIVLIIIGLLIAGITGGAALIKSAELRSVVTEGRANSVSASAFHSLYDSLPGDSANYTGAGATSIGNGDGRMDFCRTGTCTTLANSEGGALAWSHLIAAGIVNIPGFPTSGGVPVGVVSSGTQVLGSAPSILPSKVKNTGWVFEYDATNKTNVTILVAPGVLPATLAPTSSSYTLLSNLLAGDMFSIDTKNDDGNPDKGKIRAVGNAGNATTDCKTTGSVYNIAATTKSCTITYDLDVGQG